MRPLKDRLVVRPETMPEQSAGGVILPEQAQERPVRGEVLAIGPECDPIDGPQGVNVGDVVLFSKYGGVEVEHEGEDLIVLRLSDVLYVE